MNNDTERAQNNKRPHINIKRRSEREEIKKEIEKIKITLANLQRAFIESQKNNVSTVAKSDMAPMLSNQVNDLGEEVAENTADITDTQVAMAETFEAVGSNTDDIGVCMEAIAEIYELMEE